MLHNGWGWGLEVVWITSTPCPAWNLPLWYNCAVGKYFSQPLCQGKSGQVGQCIWESWTKSKKFWAKYGDGNGHKSTETARTWCWNSADMVHAEGFMLKGWTPTNPFFCTYFCSGNCQQFRGQESSPAKFKESSYLIHAVIMQHAAGFKLYLNKCTAIMGEKPTKLKQNWIW